MSLKSFLRSRVPDLYVRLQEILQDVGYYKRMYTPKKLIPHVLKREFIKKNGYELNIDNPKTYTEKIQWLKLYDPEPLRTVLTDKVAVETWVKEKIGEKYLIKTLGVYKNFEEIDFDGLPQKFVMKTNHSSGWNIIVRDKEKLDKCMACNGHCHFCRYCNYICSIY